MKRVLKLIFLLLMIVTTLSCASIGRKWKSLVGGQTDPGPKSSQLSPASYSSQPNLMVGKERRYKKVNKDNFSDEQALEDHVGSLWRKEGQGSYLFSQNNLRVLGDIVNVEIEGRVADNLTAKVALLKSALARFETPPRAPAASALSKIPSPTDKSNGSNGQPGTPGQPQNPGQNGAQNQAQAPPPPPPAAEREEKPKEQVASKFENVPCRIVEKTTDGSYRVKGQSALFIGKREYKIIVTGLVRPDDIVSDDIPSSKIIDSKFDLVASNKEVKNESSH